jgi:hypothetical protein
MGWKHPFDPFISIAIKNHSFLRSMRSTVTNLLLLVTAHIEVQKHEEKLEVLRYAL